MIKVAGSFSLSLVITSCWKRHCRTEISCKHMQQTERKRDMHTRWEKILFLGVAAGPSHVSRKHIYYHTITTHTHTRIHTVICSRHHTNCPLWLAATFSRQKTLRFYAPDGSVYIVRTTALTQTTWPAHSWAQHVGFTLSLSRAIRYG